MPPAIEVLGLGKRYQLGLTHAKSLRELANSTVETLVQRRSRQGVANQTDKLSEFWALRDVSFDVQQGEVIGVIGRNGAGKSTLLKILSQITRPTTGSAILRGRVASLLEVGTGFHPELTGRENVFLNGTILGMTKREVTRRFDQIVAFSGVEKFIDTPTKRYSSGMTVRLGFAVAAHLEPEILIVDEVLAVGDAEFQRKCLARMNEITQDGKTILFVSHNMSAVRDLCTRGLVLSEGQSIFSGDIDSAVEVYMQRNNPEREVSGDINTKHFDLHSVEIVRGEAGLIETFAPLEIAVEFTPRVALREPGVYCGILTHGGHRLAGVDIRNFQSLDPIRDGQRTRVRFRVPSLPLLPGNYQVDVHLKDLSTHMVDEMPTRFPFHVVETSVYGGRKIDGWFGSIPIIPDLIVAEAAR